MSDQSRENEFINFTLETWGTFVLAVLADKIKQRKLVLSGELLRSLEFQVIKASGEATAKLLLAFEDAGRIKDMRQISRRKQAPVEAMEEFVRKVGLSKFKRVPGYKPGRFITESAAVNRIAWGIVRGQMKASAHKPKKWFAKPFYGTINSLIDQLLNGYSQFSIEAITQSLENHG